MCMYIHFGMYMYVYIYNNNHKVFFCKDDGMVRFLRQRKQTFFFIGWWGGTASCGSKNTGRRPLTWATCRMVSAAAAGNHFSKVALYFFFICFICMLPEQDTAWFVQQQEITFQKLHYIFLYLFYLHVTWFVQQQEITIWKLLYRFVYRSLHGSFYV